MIRFRDIAIGLLAAGSFGATAHAQSGDAVNTDTSMTLYRGVTIEKNSDLSFGTVVRPNTGSSTVIIDQGTGARTFTGGVVLLGTGPNPAAGRATFTVRGEGGQTFGITVPDFFPMTRAGGSEVLLVQTANATTGTLGNSLGALGSATFGVGGTITIPDNQASGFYTGTFLVEAAYN